MKKIIATIVLAFVGFGAMAQKDGSPIKDQSGTTTSHQNGCCDFPMPIVQAQLSDKDLISKQFQIQTFFDATANEYRYKLRFTPNNTSMVSVIQGYVNYLKTVFPCVTGVGMRAAVWDLEGVVGLPNNRLIVSPIYPFFNGSTIACPQCTSGTFPNAFDSYYTQPTSEWPNDATGLPYSSNNELVFNRKYAVGIGLWVDGCKGVKDLSCASASSIRTFKISTPSFKKGQIITDAILEEFDNKGKLLKSSKITVQK